MGRRSVPPLIAVPIEIGRNKGVSDPGLVRVRCPSARPRVAHALVPGGPFVLQKMGGFPENVCAARGRSLAQQQAVLSVQNTRQDRAQHGELAVISNATITRTSHADLHSESSRVWASRRAPARGLDESPSRTRLDLNLTSVRDFGLWTKTHDCQSPTAAGSRGGARGASPGARTVLEAYLKQVLQESSHALTPVGGRGCRTSARI